MSDIESSASKMTKRLYANVASASILGHLSSSANPTGVADVSSVDSQSILNSQRSSYSSKNHRFNKIAAVCMVGLTLAGGGVGGAAVAANDMSRTPVHADNNSSDAMAEVVSDIAENKPANSDGSGTPRQQNNSAENNPSNINATNKIASVDSEARSASKAGHKGEAKSLWKKASELTDSATGSDPKDKTSGLSEDQLERKGYMKNGTGTKKYHRYENSLHSKEAKISRERRRLNHKK